VIHQNKTTRLATDRFCALFAMFAMIGETQKNRPRPQQPAIHQVAASQCRLVSSAGYYALSNQSGKQF
jgi:hypothetical protein